MSIFACSVCFFNAPDDPMSISLQYAVLALLGVLAVVLGLLAKFFINVRKREKLMS